MNFIYFYIVIKPYYLFYYFGTVLINLHIYNLLVLINFPILQKEFSFFKKKTGKP